MPTATMAPMTRSYAPGIRARRAILLELLDAGTLSTVDLARRLPISQSSVHRHVRTLSNMGMVDISPKSEGGGVMLTICGLEVARIAGAD